LTHPGKIPLNQPDFDSAKQYALDRLSRELLPIYTYHSLSHTRDFVIPNLEMLGDREGIMGEQRGLAVTAAAFHDLGFTLHHNDHETASIAIARQILPGMGFSEEQLSVIVGMICATRLPQQPKTFLEKLIVDADMFVLGMDSFLAANENLRNEMANIGKSFTDEAWYRAQLKFVNQFRFFTPSAQSLGNAQKAKNAAALAKLLEDSLSTHAENLK
jgi:uncharacterized protein